jgi:hypothetical protein
MNELGKLTVRRDGQVFRTAPRATGPASTPIGFVVKDDDGWHAYFHRYLRSNLHFGPFSLKRDAVGELGAQYAGEYL